jgi:hypothetical protein
MDTGTYSCVVESIVIFHNAFHQIPVGLVRGIPFWNYSSDPAKFSEGANGLTGQSGRPASVPVTHQRDLM